MTNNLRAPNAQQLSSAPHNPMWWFRAFCSMLDDPTFHKMPDRAFKTLIMLWALARRFDGVLPPENEFAFYLRNNAADITADVKYLRDAGQLVDKDGHLEPVDWELHQVPHDSSTARTRKWRKGKSDGHIQGHGDVTAAAHTRQDKTILSSRERAPDRRVLVKVDTPQWHAWEVYWRKENGQGLPVSPKDNGWWFNTEWPPDHPKHGEARTPIR